LSISALFGDGETSFGLWACLRSWLRLSCVRGQDQERNLVDRLLKPDMSLQNRAQNKKFIAANGASIDKRATASTFYVQTKLNSKRFFRHARFFNLAI